MNFDVNFQENENKFSAEFKNLNIVDKLATKVLIDGEVQETFVPDEYVGDAVVEMLDEGLGGKLDKVNTANRLYGTDGSGAQAEKAYADNPYGETIPIRLRSGALLVNFQNEPRAAVPLGKLNEILDDRIGDISAALDEIIKIQNALIPSKNLFNLAAIANEPSLTVDVEAGTVYVSGMTQTSIPFSAVCPKAEVGKTYTLSYKKTSPNGGIGVNGSGWDSYEFSGTFVLTDSIYNGVVYFTAFVDDNYFDLTDSTISEIMLNEGDTALPYEPYRG